MMLNELLGAVHCICYCQYYRLLIIGASFSVIGDGKTGGAAAGFALPQLARISWLPAHTCGQQRMHDSFRFAPFSYPVPDTRGVHSFPTVCCLECMRSLFPLFPPASSFQESRAHHSHRRRLWMSATQNVSDKTVPHFSLSTWCVLILRTCGAEKLRFLFVTPHASNESGAHYELFIISFKGRMRVC